MLTASGIYDISESLRTIMRVILGLLFIVSALAKVYNFRGFVSVVDSYGFLPGYLVAPIALSVPIIEFVLGTMFLINHSARIAGALLLAALIIFTALSTAKYFGGAVSDCGCFGNLVERRDGITLVIENSTIAFLVIVTTFYNKRKRR